MRFLLACILLIGLHLYIANAQPINAFNRPFNQQAPIAAANNPFAGFNQPLNNPAATAAAGPSAGFPMNQPILSGLNQPLLTGLNQPVIQQPMMQQPIMGLNAFNNPLAQQQAFPQQAFPQQALPRQALPQQNLLQQPIVGAAPQMGGLNLVGLPDQQIQQLAMQAAQPTLNQWLANDQQAIFQRAGALNQPPVNQPITAAAGGPLLGVQAIQAMPNTLAALQQQMQQPITQNLLQLNPNLAQWMQQQQLAMQQAVRSGAAPQQFPIPGNSPVGQFQVDQGPLTGANPQAIMMPSMQSRPAPQPQNQPLPAFNQPILQGSPLQQPGPAGLNAPDLQDFTLTPSSGPALQQPIDPQRPASAPQPILNQAAPGQASMNPSGPSPLAPQLSPAGPQGMPNMNSPINAPRPRP